MVLQGTGRETRPHHANPFLGCRLLSLVARLCLCLHTQPVCLCANSLLTAPLSLSPSPSACLSFLAPIPPHPTPLGCQRAPTLGSLCHTENSHLTIYI